MKPSCPTGRLASLFVAFLICFFVVSPVTVSKKAVNKDLGDGRGIKHAHRGPSSIGLAIIQRHSKGPQDVCVHLVERYVSLLSTPPSRRHHCIGEARTQLWGTGGELRAISELRELDASAINL